jgi:hypothetical protein
MRWKYGRNSLHDRMYGGELGFFDILVTVHLCSIPKNNQLDAQFLLYMFIYLDSLRVSSNPVLIIRRVNCINTTSGIRHSVSVTFRYAGREGTSRLAYRTVTYRE